MKRGLVAASLMFLLFAGVCVSENAAVRSRPPTPSDRVSSVYALAGEFRTVFANLLWIKADEYHHEFVRHGADWTTNRELLGLFDLIIMLDPQFVDAYANKAYMCADGFHDTPRAIRVLRQGISNNPRSRELYELTAVVYARRMRDPAKALFYARKAVIYSEDDWYRTRAKRLFNTIAQMALERPKA
jgi:hypothetical protein